jgi:hypothetical protein
MIAARLILALALLLFASFLLAPMRTSPYVDALTCATFHADHIALDQLPMSKSWMVEYPDGHSEFVGGACRPEFGR